MDDVLLAHGGIGPDYAGWSVPAINDTLADYAREDLFLRWSDSTVDVAPIDSTAVQRRIDFFHGPGSVFWYRGYLADDAGRGGATVDSTACAEDSVPRADSLPPRPGAVLDRMLDRHEASVHVVARTPLDRIEERFDGKLVGVDLQRPVTEMLLLVRRPESGGWERLRVGLEGEVELLSAE